MRYEENPRALALDSFPAVSSFSLALNEERHVVMMSDDLELAGFPAWDAADRDLRHFTPMDVPLGSLNEPYDDRDEAWRIVIFEHAGWVYVLEGDAPRATELASCFRVPRDRYLEAWALLIDRFNPITPVDLDETDDADPLPGDEEENA